MRILITGGEAPLAQALATALSGEHTVRLTVSGGEDHHVGEDGQSGVPGGGGTPGAERHAGDLRDPAFAGRAVAGVEAVLHLAPLWPGVPSSAPAGEVLDHAARGTYVLLTAAAAAGVRRVVLASTLDLFEGYPAEWWVSEAWRPQPSTSVAQLAAYLAECSAREISRVEPLHTICLRLGRVVNDADVAGRDYDPRWLHVDDAVQAFRRALAFDLSSRQFATTGPPLHGWWVFHIPGGGTPTRLPLAHARHESFGYRPAHTFAPSAVADLPDGSAAPTRRSRRRDRWPSRPSDRGRFSGWSSLERAAHLRRRRRGCLLAGTRCG